jgi:hypothetical protein
MTTPKFPPFFTEEDIKNYDRDMERRKREYVLTALGAARKKARDLAGEVRSDAFKNWLRHGVVKALEPADWTQARLLYESYLAHAKTYGQNRTQKALVIQELASMTQWGRMMAATVSLKTRRTAGWYYPLRVKRS